MGGSNEALAWTGEVMSILGWDSMRERSGSWGGGAGAWASEEQLQIPSPKLQRNPELQILTELERCVARILELGA
jgi:hypothetical protein